jgi:cobalamin biosynthesis protein CobD/CbiB
MADSTMVNVLLFAAAVIAPTLVFWFIVRVPRLVDGIGERVRRRRVVSTSLPIEQLAADLRRVHRLLVQCPDGTPMVRRIATRDAYDELLRQACGAVDVRHDLDTLPEGVERDMERLRVEEALRTAGLTIP